MPLCRCSAATTKRSIDATLPPTRSCGRCDIVILARMRVYERASCATKLSSSGCCTTQERTASWSCAGTTHPSAASSLKAASRSPRFSGRRRHSLLVEGGGPLERDGLLAGEGLLGKRLLTGGGKLATEAQVTSLPSSRTTPRR